ncbi:MAG: AraC family transcriptional regulator, partial [Pseudomonadota bacterium]
TLPIPLVSALILSFLLMRLWVLRAPWSPIWILLALCAAQGAIIALAQHYGVAGFRVLQPITAALLPAVAWLALKSTAIGRLEPVDVLHGLGPVLALVSVAMGGFGLDLLIPALFAGYGLAILIRARPMGPGLPHLPVAAGDQPGLIWGAIGVALIASALSDGLIVVGQMVGLGNLQPVIISVFTSGILLLVGVLSLSPVLHPDTKETTAPTSTEPPQISEQDALIFEAFVARLDQERLYLDPDLTLAHVSRRLKVPSKQLSQAINRMTGENISRFVNGRRIAAAQAMLKGGASVTNAMLDAGFNTKSNFNREFLRVSGQSPTEWRQTHQDSAG